MDLKWLNSIDPQRTLLLVLPANFEEGKMIIDWAVSKFLPRDFSCVALSVVLTKNQMVPLRRELQDRLKQIEKDKLTSVLNKYLLECRQNCQIKAYKIFLEADTITEGLLCIIRKVKIRNLVIGTTSHSRTSSMDISNKLIKEADTSCKIWFFSNGEITFTRNVENTDDGASTSTSSGDNQIVKLQEALDCDIDFHEMFEKKISEESERRANGEKEIFSICQKAILLMTKMSSDLHAQDTHWRNEFEEYLARAKQERDILKTENQQLKNGNLEIENEKIKEIAMRKNITESELATKNLQRYFWASIDRLDWLESDYKIVKESRDDARKEIKDLHERMYRLDKDHKKLEKEKEAALNATKPFLTCEFSLEELHQATNYFNDSRRIGKGRFGRTYRGHLRDLTVVVKKLDPQNLQDKSEFEQELEIVTKMRHPNIVTLIGSCPKASALVYEHFPNGTLEDRINRVGKLPPLRWRARMRMIGEICRALLFLHSNQPDPVVHGDLKPQNILLDSNLVCKIRLFGKLGVSRLLNRFQEMNPYRDPEFRFTSQLKPQSDVYSFGILLLHLLTGKPSFNLAKKVHSATDTELGLMLDQTAGNWPYNQAIKLARIGSRCANPSRNRPGLAEVWKLIEPMVRAANSVVAPCICNVQGDDHVPSYFFCPITQEIMKEPHIAADGYTYEMSAIRTWIRTGHDRSPITNLPLNNTSLTPNRALRSSIQEWLQHHPQQ